MWFTWIFSLLGGKSGKYIFMALALAGALGWGYYKWHEIEVERANSAQTIINLTKDNENLEQANEKNAKINDFLTDSSQFQQKVDTDYVKTDIIRDQQKTVVKEKINHLQKGSQPVSQYLGDALNLLDGINSDAK